MRIIEAGPRWVPVTERLPDKDGAYLTFTSGFVTKRQFIDITYFDKDGIVADEVSGNKNVWYFYDLVGGCVLTDRVTHWMPLPEPPQMDEG